jgi:hypothetical protein
MLNSDLSSTTMPGRGEAGPTLPSFIGKLSDPVGVMATVGKQH